MYHRSKTHPIAIGIVLVVTIFLINTAGAVTEKTGSEDAAPKNETEGGSDGKKAAPKLTGIPQKDYIHDPNLPRELKGYDLSDYPFYNRVPDVEFNFTCDDRHDGFYASIPHKCQVYHNCLFGVRYDFLCANYTAFDQSNFICHFVNEVDCKNSELYFDKNDALYKEETTTTTTAVPPEVKIIYVERTKNRRRQGGGGPRRKTTLPPLPGDYYYDDYYDEAPAKTKARPSVGAAGGSKAGASDDYYYYDDYEEPVLTATTTTTTRRPIPKRRTKRPRPTRPSSARGRPQGPSQSLKKKRLENPRQKTGRRPPQPVQENDFDYYADYADQADDVQSVRRGNPSPPRRQQRPEGANAPKMKRKRRRRKKTTTTTTTTTAAPEYYDDYYYYDDYDTPEGSSAAPTTTTTTTAKPASSRRRPSLGGGRPTAQERRKALLKSRRASIESKRRKSQARRPTTAPVEDTQYDDVVYTDDYPTAAIEEPPTAPAGEATAAGTEEYVDYEYPTDAQPSQSGSQRGGAPRNRRPGVFRRPNSRRSSRTE